MNRYQVETVLRKTWLPIFLVSGLSWLFGPAVYHDHYGSLQLISSYEGKDTFASLLFGLSDAVSALWLVLGLYLFKAVRHDRKLFWAIALVAALSLIDVIFADKCKLGAASCHGFAAFSTAVHIGESVLLPGLVFVMVIYHAKCYHRYVSGGVALALLALGLLAVSAILSQQQIVLSQYVYELLILSWLAWLMSSFDDSPRRVGGQWIRILFGWWALLSGALAITIGLTHHQHLQFLFNTSFGSGQALARQHAVVVGALMLYLARQVGQGQRRAAIVLLALFGSQIINYSLVTPSPALLVLGVASFVLLLSGWHLFDKNTVVPPLNKRVKDAGIVIIGVALAVLISLAISSLTGHKTVHRGLESNYQRPITAAAGRGEDVLDSYAEHQRFRIVFETLAVTTTIVVTWSLFRPVRYRGKHLNDDDITEARLLLGRWSTSSEDNFKVWPADKSYFFSEDRQGFIAYRVVNGTSFALADPIGPATEIPQLISSFSEYCRGNGWTVCFLMVPEGSKHLYVADFKLLQIGSTAVIDVAKFSQATTNEKWWRWQRNRAKKAGLRYEILTPPHTATVMAELKEVSTSWLAAGKHSEYGFALGYFDETYMQQCRLHVVRGSEGAVLGFANDVSVYNNQTQRTIDLMRYLPEQNGVMPFLLMEAIGAMASDDSCTTFDLGFVPLAGANSRFTNALRRLSSGRFSSLGLEQFKNKFDPVWQPNFMAYDGDVVDLARMASSLESLLKRPPEPAARN